MPTQGAGESPASEPVDDSKYYHWTELRVGTALHVYNRTLVILDADPFTRDFFVQARERERCPSLPHSLPPSLRGTFSL